MKKEKILNLIKHLEDLSETRIYYAGQEPWNAIREITSELAEYLRDTHNIRDPVDLY